MTPCWRWVKRRGIVGTFSAARLWWEQLIPDLGGRANPADYPTVLRYPDASVDRGAILARMILCTILEGDRDAHGDELRRVPSSSIRLQTAGSLDNKGDLSNFWFQRIIRIRRTGSWQQARPRKFPRLRLSAQRFQAIPETIDVGGIAVGADHFVAQRAAYIHQSGCGSFSRFHWGYIFRSSMTKSCSLMILTQLSVEHADG